MTTSRRVFLKQSGMAIVSVGILPSLAPLFVQRAAFAQSPQRDDRKAGGRKVLVCIFQRGAVDGLSMVVPHGDPAYYAHRPVGQGGIAIPRTGEGGVIDVDGMFGFHPSLAPLKPIYDSGHLAPIQAVGSPSMTRSHFDAQDFMESGVAGDKAVRDGWLARVLRNCPEDQARLRNPMRGVSATAQLPRSLSGAPDALAIPDLQTFGVGAGMARRGGEGQNSAEMASAFQALYTESGNDSLHGAGRELFAAMKQLEAIRAERYVPANSAVYPNGRFGESLKMIAQLIKSEVGMEVAFTESGGWDTHVNQGGAQGQLSQRLRELGAGLSAFYQDLGDRMADVVVLTMSEFGRTARQNGNGGTDHGHATCFLAMGGSVQGGKVLGQWPGLAEEQLNERRDLVMTTDYRDVFGEISARHLGVHGQSAIFPDFAATPSRWRSILRAT